MRHPLLTILTLSAMAAVLSCKDNTVTPERPDGTDDPVTGTPSITITDQGNINLEFNAETAAVHYSVTDPVDGAQLLPEAPVEWISDYDTSVEGIVTFTVADNDAEDNRSAILTLRYIYEGGEVSAQINIIQEGTPYDYVNEMPLSYGYYYGTRTGSVPNYYICLAENPMENNIIGDGYSYVIDLYAGAEPEDMTAIAPPVGEYESSETFDAWTFNIQNSRISYKDDAGTTSANITEGTLSISKEGDTYVYDGIFIDSNGEVHHVSYTGTVSLSDFSQGDFVSTLTGDYEADLKEANCSAYYYGDVYGGTSGIPTSNWIITFSPLPYSKDGDFFQMDICAPTYSNVETGIPEGRYYFLNCDYGEYTALMGFLEGGVRFGSWFWLMENAAEGDLISPLDSGYVEFKVDGDTYTVTINAYDDKPVPNAITATWTGQIQMQDMTIY